MLAWHKFEIGDPVSHHIALHLDSAGNRSAQRALDSFGSEDRPPTRFASRHSAPRRLGPFDFRIQVRKNTGYAPQNVSSSSGACLASLHTLLVCCLQLLELIFPLQ
jgi:hypothetical protein